MSSPAEPDRSPSLQSESQSTEPSASETTQSGGHNGRRRQFTEQDSVDMYSRVAEVLPHEPLDRYEPGGFHPAVLGDTLCDGRYTIRHKLGHGGFSIVWLARDSHEERWVSIKIKRARYSTDQLDDDPEIKALNRLHQHYSDTLPEAPWCFSGLLNFFHHTGPNGTHTCIVTELLGPTLATVLSCMNAYYNQEILRPDTILRASKQVLKAIEFTHQAGIVHGVRPTNLDISPSNLAFTCNSLIGSDENLWKVLGGEPKVAEYDGKEPRSPHLPRQLVDTAKWPLWYDDPYDDICLIDFGASFPVNETRSELAQPSNLRSPETFFVNSFNDNHDMWRAGCVRSPIQFSHTNLGHIQAMINARGPLPSSWIAKLKELLKEEVEEEFFARAFQTATEPKAETLIENFEPRREVIIAYAEKDDHYEKDGYIEDDYQGLRCLLHVMRGLMEHEPNKRLSAQEAAKSITWVDHWRIKTD
ncbi:hypothetical protein AK830_g11978 [Neonectria ditissima]|uniref:Protein kinase domain-containing protein n=1 Tax=Neonectria ditissima TaxID=78410 RepID=A0A0P7AQB7_9HYPO|nr:hypothetical protein AK830_g11978 [Neonectria ditissima]